MPVGVNESGRSAGKKGERRSSAPTFIDLFAGCGGFTLGLQRAGFNCLAAIDSDGHAYATLKNNITDVAHVLQKDLTRFTPEQLGDLVGRSHVDVIVGGPPCQGFSMARKVDGSNHGSKRLKEDPRRLLYRYFLKFVEHFQPKVFVVENVPGIRSAAGGAYFTNLQHEARTLGRHSGLPGYRVISQIEDAIQLGVPQKRRRQLIVGFRADLPVLGSLKLSAAPRATPATPLGAAICDLPALKAGTGKESRSYDPKQRRVVERKFAEARKYLTEVCEIDRSDVISNHVARPHNARDLRDFSRLREGETSAAAIRERGQKFEFPYNRKIFKDRFTRQSRFAACSTIVAHLGKDGLMFIHPTQNRSLTVREAARIQSFPDWFIFPFARTHAFRLIGNAVPPLVSESIGRAVRKYIAKVEKLGGEQANFRVDSNARLSIREVARMDEEMIRELSNEKFVGYWRTLFQAIPNLHPMNAADHGEYITHSKLLAGVLGRGDKSVRLFARSGWPVELLHIGEEARRRLSRGDITAKDYMAEVQPG